MGLGGEAVRESKGDAKVMEDCLCESCRARQGEGAALGPPAAGERAAAG